MSDLNIHEIIISDDDVQNFKRLDQCLSHHLPNISRTHLKDIFKKGLIYCNNSLKLELKKLPPVGTCIHIEVPPPPDLKAKPEKIPLEILFEDQHLIVINKQAGLVVHPAPGNYSGTLVSALLYHFQEIKDTGNIERPGIVHRLDKGTTGTMVIAKSPEAFEGLEIGRAHV